VISRQRRGAALSGCARQSFRLSDRARRRRATFEDFAMVTRTKRMTFRHPFSLKGVDRLLAPGNYEVVADEELIEELSFPVYRRVSTLIFLPAQTHRQSSVEMVNVDPADLAAAHERDQATVSARGRAP
jgi:hypothetical protein